MATMWPESLEDLVATDQLHQYDPQTFVEEDIVSREMAFSDTDHLLQLLHSSEQGLRQMSTSARQWERRQANAVKSLQKQLHTLDVQRLEAERKYQLIVEGQWSPSVNGDVFPTKQEEVEPPSPMEEDNTSSGTPDSFLSSIDSSLVDGNDNSVEYWKSRAKRLEQLLEESMVREQVLRSRIPENGVEQSIPPPLEELHGSLHRWENFLHFILRRAPIVFAHQDKELRYRFIYNAFPSLSPEEVLGKTDEEIYHGVGVEETMSFKREVLQRRRALRREIRFDTDLFGSKVFSVAAEPVFSNSGEPLGVNYVAMDITDEAAIREKLILLREDIAVQKAMESELHKTIDITEETMRAKQMLATMSHEIRSPLSGVVSMAEVLATTKLDNEQRQLVDVMMSSGDLVLQLLNDILDLSKVESGAMKLEVKKFRPREVVKHVLQMAHASTQRKSLSLRGTITDEVPLEVIGDVLRIRQVFTNLVSNAIKFTEAGEVAIRVRVVSSPSLSVESTKSQRYKQCLPTTTPDLNKFIGSAYLSPSPTTEEESSSPTQVDCQDDTKDATESSEILRSTSSFSTISTLSSVSSVSSSSLSTSSSVTPKNIDDLKVEEGAGSGPTSLRDLPTALPTKSQEKIWLLCEVSDTGIGIPEASLPSLFERYTQVSTRHARKYGGTGLGLAICKQLVGLMGGTLEVKSKEHVGSSFSFTLPLGVVQERNGQSSLINKECGMTFDIQVQEKFENSSKRKSFRYTPPSSSTSGSFNLPPAHAGDCDGKVKGSQDMDCKVKDYLGEFSSKRSNESAAHENILLGQTRWSDEVSTKVDLDEGNSCEPRCEMMTTGSNSQSCPVERLDPLQEYVDTVNSNTSLTSTLLKMNSPKRSSDGLEFKTPQHLPVENGILTSPDVESRPGRLPRILLAEDNPVNVMVAQSMLKRLGHSLEVVNNGVEAVRAFQECNYDLVLMDVSMPEMDGLEATRLIREYEETRQWAPVEEEASTHNISSTTLCDLPLLPLEHSDPSIMFRPPFRQRTPIIAMTANALADSVVECYNHGMDSFIAKPVTFKKLQQVLGQFIPWLDHKRVESC